MTSRKLDRILIPVRDYKVTCSIISLFFYDRVSTVYCYIAIRTADSVQIPLLLVSLSRSVLVSSRLPQNHAPNFPLSSRPIGQSKIYSLMTTDSIAVSARKCVTERSMTHTLISNSQVVFAPKNRYLSVMCRADGHDSATMPA